MVVADLAHAGQGQQAALVPGDVADHQEARAWGDHGGQASQNGFVVALQGEDVHIQAEAGGDRLHGFAHGGVFVLGHDDAVALLPTHAPQGQATARAGVLHQTDSSRVRAQKFAHGGAHVAQDGHAVQAQIHAEGRLLLVQGQEFVGRRHGLPRHDALGTIVEVMELGQDRVMGAVLLVQHQLGQQGAFGFRTHLLAHGHSRRQPLPSRRDESGFPTNNKGGVAVIVRCSQP